MLNPLLIAGDWGTFDRNKRWLFELLIQFVPCIHYLIEKRNRIFFVSTIIMYDDHLLAVTTAKSVSNGTIPTKPIPKPKSNINM